MDEPFGRVPRATGKDKQVTDIGRRKYFRPYSWHVSNIFVDEQQYTTATALEQRRERFPDANND
jgi:hypothetical protein